MATSTRFSENPTTPLRTVDAHKEFLASLETITKLFPPVQTCSTNWEFGGLYSGSTSIAFLFYRLSRVYPNLVFQHQSLLEWAKAYIEIGAWEYHGTPTPSDCGVGNEALARLAVEAVIKQDQNLVRELCSFERTINSPTDDGSNEWLYGRAGYLYLLRLCRSVGSGHHGDYTDEDRARDPVERAIESTARRILAVKQPWVWHGKQYLGAAHGCIGTITQITLSTESETPHLRPLLQGLLDLQYPSGNFPSSFPAESDKLVQFCHGGPGFVLSLRSLMPYFPEMAGNIWRAIQKAEADVWKRGILKKEPCLCHGIAGNALALASYGQFVHFLSFMSSEATEESTESTGSDSSRDVRFGLYTGEAGKAWAWAVADKGLGKKCIGYNDI